MITKTASPKKSLRDVLQLFSAEATIFFKTKIIIH